MKKIYEKYPIIAYIGESCIKSFIYSIIFFCVTFVVLKLTGIYTRMESALDLKYDSPFIRVPLYGFVALAVLCFVIGFLMYFYKYKRSKTKTKFYKNFSDILNEG